MICITAMSVLLMLLSIHYNNYQIESNNMYIDLLQTNVSGNHIIISDIIYNYTGEAAHGIIFTKHKNCVYYYNHYFKMIRQSCNYLSAITGNYSIAGYPIVIPIDVSANYMVSHARQKTRYDLNIRNNTYYVYGYIRNDALVVRCIHDNYNQVKQYINSQLVSQSIRLFIVAIFNIPMLICIGLIVHSFFDY